MTNSPSAPNPIDRRSFLRGMGISLALPFLESQFSRAFAAQATSNPRRLVCIGNHLGFWPGGFFPQDSGSHYQSSLTLKPLDSHREDFTIFSNLDHDAGGGHKGVHAFLSGVRKEDSAGFPEKNMTLDQAAAEHVGSRTRFRSLTTGLEKGTDLCWTRAGVRIPPVNNPARLFQALFVNAPQTQRNRERERLTHRASVLDALRESANDLSATLNPTDRDKLDQYLTSVRDVEQRLQMSAEWLDRSKPQAPINPIADEERMHIEEMPLFYDLLTMALQTDSTRVATFEIPLQFRTAELDVGSYHGLSHHGKAEDRLGQLQVVEKYLIAQFGRFLGQLKEAKVFEHTLVILGSGMGNASSHSNRDLPILLAGGGLKHQGHVICPEEDHKRVPLSNLWLSSLQWFGLETERFGKSTGTFSPMELA